MDTKQLLGKLEKDYEELMALINKQKYESEVLEVLMKKQKNVLEQLK